MLNNYSLIWMLADNCQHTQPSWIWQCKLQGVDALGFSVKHICCTVPDFLYPKYAATLTHLNLSVDGGHIDLYAEVASHSESNKISIACFFKMHQLPVPCKQSVFAIIHTTINPTHQTSSWCDGAFWHQLQHLYVFESVRNHSETAPQWIHNFTATTVVKHNGQPPRPCDKCRTNYLTTTANHE